jgi:hypothetical protein
VKIGYWVRRVTGKGMALTKWHRIESVVDDEPFTRCGRRFRRRTTSWFESVDAMPLTRMIGQPQLCGQCQ